MRHVDDRLIDLVVELAERRGEGVAQVPVSVVADAAGVSRSTLLRQLGGSRAALDDAVRARGIDVGRRTPVRDRAIDAAAALIAAEGVGSVTLAAVAESARCSLPAIHGAFDGRDSLLAAVFDRYSPLPDIVALAEDPPDDLGQLVRRIYQTMIVVFDREPRVLPALLGDLFSRPEGPAAELFGANLPKVFRALATLFGPHLDSGALRRLPFPLIVQQLVAPMMLHLVLRPGLSGEVSLPSVDETVDIFTATFLRAVATDYRGEYL